MNLKYIKHTFIIIIAVLTIIGIYIIYFKDNNKENMSLNDKQKEINVSKDIIIGITEFDTINPLLTKSLEVQYITKLIYEPLLNITQDFHTEPKLATEVSKIDDLIYIVQLDNTKYWDDGTKLTPKDIEFTIKTIKSSDSIYLENVKNIEKIEIIDDNTFKIYLVEPVQFFEYLLCFPIVEENTYNEQIPKGSGNFKIETLNQDEIILKDDKRTITIKKFKTIAELYNNFTRENVDLIITKNTNYAKYIGNIGFEESIITGREFYYISCKNLNNKNIRKLINYTINREKLIYDLYNNKYKAANFPLDYGSYLSRNNNTNEEIYNRKTINLTMSSKTSDENKEIMEAIKEQLEDEKIHITTMNYLNSNSNLILRKQTVPIVPDLREYFNKKEDIEKFIKISQIENDDVLKQEYSTIIDEYYEEMPFIGLFFDTYILLHNNKLKGDFSGNWYNIFYNIETWYKE